MNKNLWIKPIVIASGAALVSIMCLSTAMAKSRLYHRLKTSAIVEIPEKAKVPAPNDYRAVTDAEAKKLGPKKPMDSASLPSSADGKQEKKKYHEIATSRIVFLSSAKAGKGYETEEQYLKSKK